MKLANGAWGVAPYVDWRTGELSYLFETPRRPEAASDEPHGCECWTPRERQAYAARWQAVYAEMGLYKPEGKK